MVDKSAKKIQQMFGSITGSYDFLNHLLSFNMDRGWRKKTISMALNKSERPVKVLDLCTGTGDILMGFGKQTNGSDLLVGCDFTFGMLEIAQTKSQEKNLKSANGLICGDALKLPFADNSFDIVTVGFGVRNFENLENGLKEMVRVVAPGGKILILECSNPKIPGWREFYKFYFTYIMPKIGDMVSGTRSYFYLRDSVHEFVDRVELKEKMEQAGMDQVQMKPLALGSIVIHLGEVK